jgi:hypothetical protein
VKKNAKRKANQDERAGQHYQQRNRREASLPCGLLCVLNDTQCLRISKFPNVHVHPNLLPTPGVASKRDDNVMPRGAYWPRLPSDGYHHSIRHANDVTLGRHDRHHTRRHAGHQATRQLLSQHLPTPGWPSLTLGPAGVATRTGHHTADSAPTIPRRLATPARNDSPHQPGPSLQGADKAIPLHINRLSFPTLSLCCIPFLSVRHAIQSLLIRLLVFVYSL